MQEDPKLLVLGLLGSTYGDLKKLDDQITSSSSTLGRRSEIVKQEMVKIAAAGVNQAPAAVFSPPRPPPNMVIPPPNVAIAPQPNVVIASPPQMAPAAIIQPPKDDNQLEFDFNRAARYDELIEIIEKLEKKIDTLSTKIDNLSIAQPKAIRKKEKVQTVQQFEPTTTEEIKKK